MTRGLCRTAATMMALTASLASAQGPRTVWDAIYSNEQADRGEKLYAESCCAMPRRRAWRRRSGASR